MGKYRKIVPIVEAFQMTDKLRKDLTKCPQWIIDGTQLQHHVKGAVFIVKSSDPKIEDKLLVNGRYLLSIVNVTDFIVKDETGGLLIFTPETFATNYEEVK
jgi:hypothetical protein